MLAAKPKRKTVKTHLLTLLLTAMSAPLWAANIEGIVVSAATHHPLTGVKVQVVGSTKETFTDDTGHFLLRDIDEGNITLHFNYLGLPEKTTQYSTHNADDLHIEMGNDERVERITVTGQREAQDKALNLYRSADAITNYLSADSMGQFVDQNAAESLQRIPGVTISRDQGEGRFVSVRGISPGLNSVSIDGMPMGSPEDSSRATPLDLIPTGSVEQLSVTKVPTPDMPGDAIGGALNIKTASPFDHKSSVRYRVEGTYNDLADKTSPKGRLNFNKIFNDHFAISFGINGQRRHMQSDDVEAEYDMVDAVGGDEAFAMKTLEDRKYDLKRTRIGANLNMEYRTDRSRYYLKTIYSNYRDAEGREKYVYNLGDGELASNDNHRLTYQDLDGDTLERRIRFRTKKQKTRSVTLGADHDFKAWSLDYKLGYNRTTERTVDEHEGYFEYQGDGVNAVANAGNGIPHVQIFNPDGTANTAHFDNSNYLLDKVKVKPKTAAETQYTAVINAQWPYAFGYTPLTLKAGARLQWKNKNIDNNERSLKDVPDLSLARFTAASPDYQYEEMGDGISAGRFMDYVSEHRDQFRERSKDVTDNQTDSLAEDYQADENIYASYLMGTLDYDRWRIITGVRMEHTDFSAEGNQLTLANDQIAISTRSSSHNYTDFLPSLNVAYDITDELRLRLAWSNTLARPSFSELAPHASIHEDDREIERGNPDLKPYESMNWDAMLDWYPAESSVVSLGLFYKDIDNYVVDVTDNNVAAYQGYDVTTPTNSDDATIKGAEFNAQYTIENNTLDWLNGFLVGGNGTYLDSELHVASRPGETFILPDTSEKAANLYIGYERDRFSSRLSWNYKSKTLSELGDSSTYDIYEDAHQQLDFTASYSLAKHLDIMFEATNITDEPLRLYQGSSGYIIQNEKYGPTYGIALKGRF